MNPKSVHRRSGDEFDCVVSGAIERSFRQLKMSRQRAVIIDLTDEEQPR
jgi:hypothetical protein